MLSVGWLLSMLIGLLLAISRLKIAIRLWLERSSACYRPATPRHYTPGLVSIDSQIKDNNGLGRPDKGD
ncbi:uncharacterized protein K460DRAFT_127392 [Cucurbitaria berberidis CBS 394.84]|uniref:Uncharacterized protein n=1 Tax=Cucurbitaria berberidis CBS 394.84 TaxID=1168544 RepID=A0A9P4GK90_9PLEO|nr:uncharacterized protein K460DRAFT_127392 [Cucurbitaria berberidis CBS 394.84]KAF1846640.1 hypothetical protein K460DRAFT_127392 [Cucurbitaria berberidis CBS 394.84]